MNNKMICCICGVEITEKNKSGEHIIHNAIGGLLVDYGIYCKKCNGSFGTDQDKNFVQIFAPIVDNFNIKKDRDGNGSSYTGVLFDENGKKYKALYKDKKIVKVTDLSGKYVGSKPKKGMRHLYFDFSMDSDAFKVGVGKIAFNYAIHSGIKINELECLFDSTSHKFIRCICIPFIPLTTFDELMEKENDIGLYHALRVFNCKNQLFAYIELFSTFQIYVLLSQKWNPNIDIDKSYAQYIEKKENDDKYEEFIPRDIKDAQSILNQYKLNEKEIIDNLKKYHNYDSLNRSEQIKLLYNTIGKQAYNLWRKQSYKRPYEEIVDSIYSGIDFVNEVPRSYLQPTEEGKRFWDDFQYYTDYDKNKVDLWHYKKYLPNGTTYPVVLSNKVSYIKKSNYGIFKFKMLENRLKKDVLRDSQNKSDDKIVQDDKSDHRIILVGIVTYNPDIIRIKESIEAILTQTDEIYIFDNGSKNINQLEQILNIYDKHIILCKSKTNKGIAAALSKIMSFASEKEYKWVLTLDQDSVLQPGIISVYSKMIKKLSYAGMFTCLIKDRNFSDNENELQTKKIKEVPYCITSGALTSVKAYNETSGYDNSFFIDGVDFDICYSLREKGYKIYRVNHLGLIHEVGHGENRQLFGKSIVIYNESPNRVYFMARNKIKLFKKHKEYGLYTLVTKEMGLLFRICFYEKDKLIRIKEFWKGIFDGIRTC